MKYEYSVTTFGSYTQYLVFWFTIIISLLFILWVVFLIYVGQKWHIFMLLKKFYISRKYDIISILPHHVTTVMSVLYYVSVPIITTVEFYFTYCFRTLWSLSLATSKHNLQVDVVNNKFSRIAKKKIICCTHRMHQDQLNWTTDNKV